MSDLINLGHAPYPATVRDTIVYHIAHGALMHYPAWSILKFAWRNRRCFVDPPQVVDAQDGDSPLARKGYAE